MILMFESTDEQFLKRSFSRKRNEVEIFFIKKENDKMFDPKMVVLYASFLQFI